MPLGLLGSLAVAGVAGAAGPLASAATGQGGGGELTRAQSMSGFQSRPFNTLGSALDTKRVGQGFQPSPFPAARGTPNRSESNSFARAQQLQGRVGQRQGASPFINQAKKSLAGGQGGEQESVPDLIAKDALSSLQRILKMGKGPSTA